MAAKRRFKLGHLASACAVALPLAAAVAGAGLSVLRVHPARSDEAVGPQNPPTQNPRAPGKTDSENVFRDEGVDVRHVVVTVHKSRTLRLDWPFASAVVGSTEISDVLPMSDRVLYVQGKKVGTTNVSIFDKDKQLIGVIDIEVALDAKNIAEKIRSITKSPGIRVTSNDDQLVLSGEAKSAVDADRAVAIARDMQPEAKVINAMTVIPSAPAPAQQVLLKVRFLEASREAGRALGVNLFVANARGNAGGFNTGTGTATDINRQVIGANGVTTNNLPLFDIIKPFVGATATGSPFGVALAHMVNNGVTVDAMISALETKNLVRLIAEPELIAISGDTASFLAGGQIPVPVPQSSSGASTMYTIQWQPYGVQLTFAPTVLAGGEHSGGVSSAGLINLRLTPSVSELDYAHAVSIGSTSSPIPALTVREARTMIELRDGQSFAIAGLLATDSYRDVEQTPWLGNIPVLGTLFRSAAFRQRETDLVVIVTPHLVAPMGPGQNIATPFDQSLPGNDIDFFLLGQPEVRKRYAEYLSSGGEIKGPYGHIMPFEPKQPKSPAGQ
jgi:pilus assembly protein CpaC